MNEFFATIFNWFSSFYSQNWDNFLYDQEYYSYIGLILVLIAVLTSALYYFAPIVKFAGRGKWFIFMLIMAIIVFLVEFGVSDYWAQNATEEELPEIDTMDELGTSLISTFWCIVSYFFISLAMMWFSIHNYKQPFVKY